VLVPAVKARQGVVSLALPSLGTVQSVSLVLSASMIPLDIRKRLGPFVKRVLNPSMQYHSQEEAETLWSSHVLPILIKIIRDPKLIDANLKLHIEYYTETWSRQNMKKYRKSIQTLLMEAFEVNTNGAYIDGKRLTRFSNGDLAILPSWIQQGDIVTSPHTSSKAIVYIFRPLFVKLQGISEDEEVVYCRYIARYFLYERGPQGKARGETQVNLAVY
jgi:hypothetical protein